MDAWVDLHLHSCLSPCAEDDMTPWNIVGMASLKGLNAIAVTDHNAAFNLPAAMAAGKELDVTVIPGIEVTTKEEVHLLGYFGTLEEAMAFGALIYARLPNVPNNPELFGRQLLVQEDDSPCGELEKLLIAATDLGLDEVERLIVEHHGIAVPAHINRGSNGMIGALGLMPLLPQYPVVEVSPLCDCPAYAMKGRRILRSSDAHRLCDISERTFSLSVNELSVYGILAAISPNED